MRNLFSQDYRHTRRNGRHLPTHGPKSPTHKGDKPAKPDHRKVHHPAKGQLTLEDFLELDAGGGYGSRK